MSIELFPLLREGQSDDEQFEVARSVKRFVHDDFVRAGMPEKRVRRDIADPADDEQVRQQLHRMYNAAPGVEYLGVASGGELSGIAKVGPWHYGDEDPFRARELRKTSVEHASGLHVFAIREGLALAALNAIYYEVVSPDTALKGAVHERDEELQAAFTELGAPDGPRASNLAIPGTFVLRRLPPRE